MRIHMHQSGGHLSAEASEQNPPLPVGSSTELRFLDPDALALKREGSRLHLQGPDDEEWRPVSLAHLFPLSEPEGWIAILDKDGKEIGVMKSLRGLNPDALALAREELYRRYVVPQIRRVLYCRQRFDLLEWEVETDRGLARFITRNLREQVQQHRPNHFTFTDVEGNRYDVPDLLALDPDSRSLLESYL